MSKKDHSADEYLKFKPRKLNLSPTGNKKRKLGACEKCGDDSGRLIKGKCLSCYGDGQRAKKRKKTNPLFPRRIEKKKVSASAPIATKRKKHKPRVKERTKAPRIKPSDPYLTVFDIRRRPLGDFTKAQAEEFFNLKWESINSFLRTGRPVHGLYRIAKYIKPS